MAFEFDVEKSARNKAKHGIDFVEAQSLWSDPELVEVPVKVRDEPRFLVIGKIDEKHWSGVITYSGGSEKIRLISVRRSREEEIDIYEGP